MTDKQYEREKKRVGKYITRWQRPMGLGWWKINYSWSRDLCEEAPSRGAETDMNRWQYREADIIFYLSAIKHLDDDELEAMVVHELCHVLLSTISVNMRDLNDDYQHDLMEFNTELVAASLRWIREEGFEEGKRERKSNRSK